MDWDFDAKVCGNCRHWQLSGYSRNQWNDGEWSDPRGIGGYHCDGSVSDCRRHAPIGAKPGDVIKQAIWPQTGTQDSCGDFERREGDRKLKEHWRVNSETNEIEVLPGLMDWRGNVIPQQ